MYFLKYPALTQAPKTEYRGSKLVIPTISNTIFIK